MSDLGEFGVRDLCELRSRVQSSAHCAVSAARAPSPGWSSARQGSGPPRKSLPSTIRLREGLTIAAAR